ncbi:MAG: TRAP transporter small permease subunit [Gammaproteobacteria bacterium]|jgi:TRAP-type C4-dicarboxylate transport system permease small subunit
MALLRQLRDVLILIETWLAAGSLLLLLCLAVVQILARNLFDIGFADADTLTRYLVLYVTFFGAVVAVERDRHIKVDICCVALPTRALHALYRPMRAIAGLVCGALAEAAVRFWLVEWQYAPPHERWQLGVALVIPVGFILLTLQFALAALLGQEEAPSCPTL